jgi:His-Xaa-Ser system radical SAM maturase HxsC
MLTRRFKGVPIGLQHPIVGRFSRDSNSGFEVINTSDADAVFAVQPKAIICSESNSFSKIPSVVTDQDLSEIQEGDIVVLRPDGAINNLYQVNATHNSFLMTEMCNSKCLMCSQPPKVRDDIAELYEINRRAIPLIPKTTPQIGFSGGEPTLLEDKFIDLIGLVKNHLPDTHLHVLSNGRRFADLEYVEKVASVGNYNLMFGIPLYADNYIVHDYVVQAKGAFDETIAGLYNLASRGVRIELRVVLHKATIPGLLNLCKFIYKNLTFVEHVALMGLEYTGFTKFNYGQLEIDPYDYKDILTESVLYLDRMKMKVSVYNLQLCITDPVIWPFLRKSISDWKNDFHDQCVSCTKKKECPGFFTWNLKAISTHIKAFEN